MPAVLSQGHPALSGQRARGRGRRNRNGGEPPMATQIQVHACFPHARRSPSSRWGLSKSSLWSLAAMPLLWGVLAPPAAVRGADIPSREYYISYLPYYDGRFWDAKDAFREAFALKGANGRWVDA